MPSSRPLEERFWEKVDKNGPAHQHKPDLGRCWVWTHYCNEDGYGRISESAPSRKLLKTHRLSYELHVGPIPVGLEIRHSCDNPPCVNPEHLLCGTHQDNMDDMVERGRAVYPKGEKHGSAKLTEEQVASIRQDYVYGSRTHGLRSLGRKYGVTYAMIGFIIRGENWR